MGEKYLTPFLISRKIISNPEQIFEQFLHGNYDNLSLVVVYPTLGTVSKMIVNPDVAQEWNDKFFFYFTRETLTICHWLLCIPLLRIIVNPYVA